MLSFLTGLPRPPSTTVVWFLSSEQQRQVSAPTLNAMEPSRVRSFFEKMSIGPENGSEQLKEVITCNSDGHCSLLPL